MPEEKTAKGSRSEARQRRLAAELRANIGKRREQVRARARAENECRPERPPPDRPGKT